MATREDVLALYNAGLANNRVLGFFAEHRALSNMHEEQFPWGGYVWPSSENAYMWSKIPENHPDRKPYALMFTTIPPKEAKKQGQAVPLRTDWSDVRIPKMREILRAKFAQCTVARRVLLSTGSALLEECNWWSDRFWGTVDSVGENNLGKLLMEIREDIS